MHASALTFTGVGKTFREGGRVRTALTDVNLSIRRGEFFMILGPSGCGKSTLLRIASGLDHQSHGSVVLASDLTTRDIGFVFQHFALLPWLTVAENIGMGLIGRGVADDERHRIVRKELARFGLEKSADNYPRELSGGMRQRVGIARAFATSPSILFMDEPFSELDSFIAQELRRELLALWQERGTTIIMVSHIIDEAIELADRIAVMTGQPGTIAKVIDNHVPRPRNLRSSESYALHDQLNELVRAGMAVHTIRTPR